MTLHLYFARKFTLTVLAIFGMFGVMLVLLDMVDQIRRFDIGTIGLGEALHLSALKVPGELYQILPLIVVLATVALFLGLARTSELVVTRASGRSAMRALVAPVLTALVLGGIAVALMNPIVAATSKKYRMVTDRYKTGETSVLSVSSEGLWLREGGPEGQMVIRAARANAGGTRFHDVTFLAFGPDGSPAWRIEAAEAALTPGGWEVRTAKRWNFGGDTPNPEAAATEAERLVLPSDMTADRIRDSFAQPSAIAIWDLPAFIASLEQAGFSARSHRVWFQMELAMPLVLAAMVLLSASFTMRHTRFGRTGQMVMLALGLGLGLFFLRNFAQVLGENGQIPVALAAWSPPMAGILFSLGLLLHLEDG
ncbi:LPS export ABC transporter permease LptG [Rhodovulum euryhalinum]|uniref:Lipopolysaccharide export system permease protein n=1 Tax=Rhodovulum euryhalinum TaxID=35805 RepID=A0A4R2KIV6_9RHOB|nr:LPS export ABC transporter permease LptG [Rhodovulum euryhalinum]TCO70486.1 lipopolysaccharide export system permease protein [Rhodovulum euryhalinum]